MGAEVRHQAVKGRLGLFERAFDGLGDVPVSVGVLPYAVTRSDPATLDFQDVESPRTTDEEVDLAKALVCMARQIE